jgi:hypothetical protein
MANSAYTMIKVDSDGKISAASMVVGLVRSGVALDRIKLYRDMTAEQRAAIRAELGL